MTKRVKRGTKTSLRRTQAAGDISRINLNAFSSRVVNPLRIHRFIGRSGVSALSGGTGALGVGQGYTFQLSQCVDYTDWTAVFDQYRVVAVELTFSPYGNVRERSSVDAGRLFTCIDFDDASSPTSANDVRRFDTCIVTQPWQSVTRRLAPRCADALYSGAFTSYGSEQNKWVDCSSPSVQHYGVKAWIDTSTTIASNWSIEAKFYLEFRGQHNS